MCIKNIIFFLLLAAGSYAQSPQMSIFDALERYPKANEGAVAIHQSNAIKRLVGSRFDSENIEVVEGKEHLKTWGYRIQVYSGNNQRTSKSESEAMEIKIKNTFANLKTYRRLDAPWWRLHVGNFQSIEEAWVMVRELQKLFPQSKKDIYLVEDMISLPMD